MNISLSQKSISEAKKKLNKYKQGYTEGIKLGVKAATEALYQRIIEYCERANIVNDISGVHIDFDENTNVGRVWTNNIVIIFNEMGTGVVGSKNPHPSSSNEFKSWKYDVNEHGEKGWLYPKEDGTYGWTKGLPSKHMFYDAFNDIKDELSDYIEVELRKTIGDLY